MKLLSNIILLLTLGGLLSLAAIKFVYITKSVPAVVAQVDDRRETTRPARLDVVVVTDGTCPICTSFQPFIDALKKQNVEFSTIKQIDGTTEDGKNYISQQKLKSFPAVVVSGETSRSSTLEQFFTQTSTRVEDWFTYYAPAPYHEVASDKTRGLFNATYLTSTSCSSCYDVLNNGVALKNLAVNITEDKVVSVESVEGQELVRQYKIQNLPTVILTGDLEVYPAFQKVWPQVGSIENDGSYVLREGVKLMGTYYDLKLKQMVTPPPNN